MPTTQFLFGKISSRKFALPTPPHWDMMVKYLPPPLPRDRVKSNINKLCLEKISLQKAVRIKSLVDYSFSNMLYDEKRKPGNTDNQQKAF